MRNYAFVDMAPKKGVNYYHIKQLDLDGGVKYSTKKSLLFSPVTKLTWYSPVNRSVDIQLLNGENEAYQLTDMNGRLLRQGRLVNSRVTISQLPIGTYGIRVLTATGILTDRILVK